MTPCLKGLLKIGEDPLGPRVDPRHLGDLFNHEGNTVKELGQLLSIKNGFYAFESALLVRPLDYEGLPLGIIQWNVSAAWKCEYGHVLDEFLCFAEDIFGGQFALGRDMVVAIDPETGDVEQLAKNLEGWADVVLRDPGFRTGYLLANAWKQQYGQLAVGYRLAPKIPFVTGGEFAVENLYSAADIEAMRFRGSIASQIRDIPDGGHVIFEVKPTSASVSVPEETKLTK